MTNQKISEEIGILLNDVNKTLIEIAEEKKRREAQLRRETFRSGVDIFIAVLLLAAMFILPHLRILFK